MSTIQSRRAAAKKKAALFGAASIALYAAVFVFSQQILKFCAEGGLHNIAPVATVFLFSYVHGSFASNFWTACGIEASHNAGKKVVKTTEPRPAAPVARPRVHAAN
jgi:hypothetical protein